MIRILIAITVPFVFLSISWGVFNSGSDNKLRDISKTASLCTGFLSFMALKPSQLEAFYPYFAGLFVLSTFLWVVSVLGLKEGVYKIVVAMVGLLFAVLVRPDLFQWVLN